MPRPLSCEYNIPMTLKLRDYQAAGNAKVREAHASGVVRPAVVLPTGGGKTVMFADLARGATDAGDRALVLVHRDELVRQTVSKVHAIAPKASIGVVKAAENGIDSGVVVASVQTLAREHRRMQLPTFGLVIVDECHHAVASTYVDTLTHVGSFEKTPTVGFTATLARSDKSHLGDVWQEVVFKRDILWMIRQGYLCDVSGLTIEVPDFDLDDVRRSGSDYGDNSLGAALLDSSAGQRVFDAWNEHASERPTVLFAPTVASTQMFADVFTDNGVKTECVFGSTKPEERQAIFKRFREGTTKVLANCMVLTEGWDEPVASCAIIARPTKSAPLYIQMVGRILRTFPTKTDGALVLDVAGVAGQHALCSLIDLTESKPKKGELAEGESLRDAADRWDEEDPTWDDSDQATSDAPLKLTPVDLFARSHSAWGKTYGGTWFLSSEKHTYFLWELADGSFNVRRSKDSWTLGPQPELLAERVDLEFGMSIAEAAADDDDTIGSISGKNAAWRKGNARPTAGQISLATRMQLLAIDDAGEVILDDGRPMHRMTGEVLNKRTISAAIDTHKVSGWFRRFGR